MAQPSSEWGQEAEGRGVACKGMLSVSPSHQDWLMAAELSHAEEKRGWKKGGGELLTRGQGMDNRPRAGQ